METFFTADEAKNQFENFRNKSWRVNQKEAIEWAMDSDKRFRIIEAGTGSGKTLISMTCGAMAGLSNYLCGTKLLQTQVANDFPEAKSLFGRNNYSCLLDRSRTCEQCISTKSSPCHAAHRCLYKLAKKETVESKLRILSYKYFLSEIQFAGKFTGAPLTVIDEADSLESVLIGHISLQFSERALYRLGLSDGPERKSATSKAGIEPWLKFGKIALDRSNEIIDRLKNEISSWSEISNDYQLEQMRELDYFVHLSERCEMFIKNVDKTWEMEETERRGSIQGMLTFRPLWISEELAESFLWRYSDNWILLSASFLPLPVLCKTLGIPEDEVDYKQIPSNFPVERRPINLWPVGNLSNKTMDEELPKVINGIKKILSWHKGEKGLIHSTSFKLTKQIIEGVKDKRLIYHTPYDKQDVLEDFINSDEDWVMVSPSMDRGVDLPYDKCRFIICCKMPFFSLGDRITSKRLYSGPIGRLWYEATAMKAIQQSVGRGFRAADDFCTSYLLDEQIERVYLQRPSLWPDDFSDAITWGRNELIECEKIAV